MPFYGTRSNHQKIYYASSEPVPVSNGSSYEQSPKGKEYPYDRTDRVFEEEQRRSERHLNHWLSENKTLRKEIKALKESKKAIEELAESRGIELFDSRKKAKDYDGAEKLYQDIMKGRDSATGEDEVILGLKHSYAATLMEQKRFPEAESISRTVWEKREQDPGPLSELSKESHRQLCSILCALGRYKDAEKMHRFMFQSEPMDPWALENGDEVCQRLKEQGEHERAKDMQDQVWKERLRQSNPRDGATIRSGLRLIQFHEKLVATIDSQGGTDVERRRNVNHKEASECEIEITLGKIWGARHYPEPNTDILNAGHELGVIRFRQNQFSDAESIFNLVLESRRQHLGDDHAGTLSTRSMFGRALCRQDKPETYRKAVEVLQDKWQIMVRNRLAEAIPSVEDLAHAHLSLGEWQNAEQLYAWIVPQKEQNRNCSRQEIEDTRWKLCQTLYKQGLRKSIEAARVLDKLYLQWKASSPDCDRTLQCGHMLAQSLSAQKRYEEALKIAVEVFNARRALAKKGADYLNSAYIYGSLLLEVERSADAERTLKSAWEHLAEGNEEEMARSKCGHLYGQALLKRKRYSDAKRTLESVIDAQEVNSAGLQDIADTRKLLEDVQKEKEKGRGKEKEKRKSGGFLSRTTKKR